MLWLFAVTALAIGLFRMITSVSRELVEPTDIDEGKGENEAKDEGHEGWVPYADHLAGIDRPDIPNLGKWARFSYVDATGVVTKRSVTMWEKRGRYIVGWDRKRQAERTFRQDRISEWVCG